MANDDEKTVVEQGDNKEASEGEEKKKSGGKNMIMLGGIGVGAIVIGLVLALFVVKPMMSSDSSEADATEEVSKDDSHSQKKEHKPEKKKEKKSSSHGHGEEGTIESYVYMISDIVVNPAGTGGSRFLSVSFGFELESNYMMRQFEAKEPIIRDALITIMSSKTVAHLTDPKQKEIIRLLIKRKVSRIMKTDELAGVYYTDFVLQ